MESQISPLITSSDAVLRKYPKWDDPYAYVTGMDALTKHEYYYIDEKINQGWITERDIEIVRFIFIHRWITLHQLQRIFFADSVSEDTLKKRIRKLLKYGLVRRVQWKTYCNMKENRESFYELGSSGADVLKYKFGTFLGNRDPRLSRQTQMLYRMKYVITNEFYFQLRERFNLKHFEFHPILKMNEEQQIPTAQFILRSPKGKDLEFFLVVHREDEKWLKTLRYQCEFYSKYLSSEKPAAILVVIVSSLEKAITAHKVILQEGIDKKVWFLIDDDLYNNERCLTQSFFVINNNEKQYYDLS